MQDTEPGCVVNAVPEARAMHARSTASESPASSPARGATGGGQALRAAGIDVHRLLRFVEDMLLAPGDWMILHGALQEDRSTLVAGLLARSQGALAEWCHHAGGALTALDQPCVRDMVNRFDALAKYGTSPEMLTAGESLVDLYDYLLAFMEEHALGAA